jgi:hypothetical protein
MCRRKNCFWHQIPSLVESEPILALHGTHCCAASGSVAARKCSFYSRRTPRLVGQNCYHLALIVYHSRSTRSSLCPLAAVLLFCASCFSQAGSSRKPPSLSDVDEVRIGKVLAAKFVEFEAMGPTRQTRKIDVYLQTVGDKLAAHAQRKLPYRFH